MAKERGIGGLTARLLLETGESENRLAQISQELDQVTQAFKDGTLTVDQYSRGLKLLSKEALGLKDHIPAEEVEMLSDAMRKLDKQQTGNNIPSLEKFRHAQFMQNFVVREGTHALTSMVFALGFLTQGNAEVSESAKAVQTSLLAGAAAMNAVEFAAYGLTRAGIVGLSAIAPWAAILIGLTAGLVSFFAKSEEAADKAATGGLEKHKEALQKIYDLRVKLGMITPEQQLEDIEVERAFWLRERTRLSSLAPVKVIDRAATPGGKVGGEIERPTPEISHMEMRRVGTDEQILAAEQKILELEERRSDVNKGIASDAEKELKAREKQMRIEDDVRKGISDRFRQEKEADQKQETDFTRFQEAGLQKLNELRLNAISDEEKKIDLKYRLEGEKLKTMFVDETQLREAASLLEQQKAIDIAEVRKKKEKEIADLQRHNMESLMSGLQDLAQGIGQALGEGGSEFVRALMTALRLMQQIQALSALKAGESESGSILSIIGSVIGLVSMFDEGGRIGGTLGQPRLIVAHGGEMVLPTHRYSLPQAFHKVMSYDNGGVVGGGSGMFASMQQGNDIVQAIRELKIEVHLRNTLSGQRFLRDEMPPYEEFQKSKQV